MTIYNITKMLTHKDINAIKKYLQVDKILFMYSSWNKFNLRANKEVKQAKINACLSYLHKKYNLGQALIKDLTSYPTVNVKGAKDKRELRKKLRAS